MEITCDILKVISMTKKGLHVGLFIGFVLLSSFALKDLVSYDKTIQVNKFNQNYIRDFPSFTVCTSGLFLDPNQLQNGVMNQTPIDLEIQAFINSESEKNWTSFDMLNQSEFNEHFDGSFDWSCKTWYWYYSTKCLPCFRLRIHSLKDFDVVKAIYFVKVNQLSENEYGPIVTLHDSNQSLSLRDSVEWTNTFFYPYRTGKQ